MLPRITIEGRLTADPELKFMPNGKAKVRVSVVAADRMKNGDKWEDGEPCFLYAECWDVMAENVSESLRKGDNVVVSGKLEQRHWQAADGGKRSAFVVVISEIGPTLRFRKTPHSKDVERAKPKEEAATAPGTDPWASPTQTAIGDDPPY